MEALATDRPDISRGRIHHYQPQRFSHRVESARRWMFERPARAGVIAGAACFAALLFTFSAWVHHCYEGHYYGPFLTSNWFGVPAAEAAAGVQPVVPTDPGWDGQFYYFQSNDILITTDARHHMDNPSYRYQRVGIPLLARVAATVLGFHHTPPYLYHLVQLFLTSVGFGVMVYWLGRNQLSKWFALCWLGNAALITGLFNGMPDSSSEAFFLVALLAVLTRHLGLYVVAASVMSLCREGYVVFPAAIFLLSLVNAVTFDGTPYWRRMLWLTLPGVVTVGWAAFVAHQLHAPILGGGSGVPWGGLMDWPFFAFFKTLRQAYYAHDPYSMHYKIASAVTLLVAMFAVVKNFRRAPALLALAPLLILTSMNGTIIWSADPYGHMKNNGPVLVLCVAMLAYDRGMLLRFILVANLVVGLHMNLLLKVNLRPYYSPAIARAATEAPKTFGPPNAALTDFRCTVTATEEPRAGDPGFWSWCHRETMVFHVTVTNRTAVTWQPAPAQSPYQINIGYRIRGEDGIPQREGRMPLPRAVGPGESVELTVPVIVSRSSRPRSITITPVQEGKCWFDDADPAFAYRVELPPSVH